MDTESTDALDRQDMARLASGHDTALNDLMTRHAQRLFHYLIRQLRDESDAEDLAQETFVRVFQHRQKFNPTHRFSTWLYTIATNLVRDRQRWRTRHPQVSLDAENESTGGDLKDKLPATGATPEEKLIGGERAAAVRAAIAKLPEDLRTVILLFEYEEQSQQEIAAVLNCTPKAVEMRLYRARQELRECLASLL
ncbi:MAG TPA: RNA polymerase sigma factor [Verrucomicrobiae bacterium]|jgi:RNA polymerase sigma-70 factor (ECF subfamily)